MEGTRERRSAGERYCVLVMSDGNMQRIAGLKEGRSEWVVDNKGDCHGGPVRRRRRVGEHGSWPNEGVYLGVHINPPPVHFARASPSSFETPTPAYCPVAAMPLSRRCDNNPTSSWTLANRTTSTCLLVRRRTASLASARCRP